MYLGSGRLYVSGRRRIGPKVARRARGRKRCRKPFRRFIAPLCKKAWCFIGNVKNFQITPKTSGLGDIHVKATL